ncbi:MAG: R3H domain-containing nucleic acid-binding protein [Patescibacteria group bacterium]
MNEALEIKKKIEMLVSRLGFGGEAIVKQRDQAFLVHLAVDTPAILIGRDGEGLYALQHLLRLLCLRPQAEGSRPIILDINGYREKKEDFITQSVKAAIAAAEATGQEQILPPMNSFERRLIHVLVAKHPGFTSESTGEGPERQVVIKPAG